MIENKFGNSWSTSAPKIGDTVYEAKGGKVQGQS